MKLTFFYFLLFWISIPDVHSRLCTRTNFNFLDCDKIYKFISPRRLSYTGPSWLYQSPLLPFNSQQEVTTKPVYSKTANSQNVFKVITTKPVYSKTEKFQHAVTLMGKYTDYKEETMFGFIKMSVPYTKQVDCGASLLSNNYVITAASCLFNNNGEYKASKDWKIYINGVKKNINAVKEFQTWIADRIKLLETNSHEDSPYYAHPVEFYVNPQYDKLTYNNDIAIIKIKPVNLTDMYYAGPISLPPPEVTKSPILGPKITESCWYAGWGCTLAKGNFAITVRLLEAEVKIKPCFNMTSWILKPDKKKLMNNYLCAQAPNTEMCSGDTGGGLICKSKTGKMYLAGIASSGTGQNPRKFPSKFMKVSAYVDWIRNVTNLN